MTRPGGLAFAIAAVSGADATAWAVASTDASITDGLLTADDLQAALLSAFAAVLGNAAGVPADLYCADATFVTHLRECGSLYPHLTVHPSWETGMLVRAAHKAARALLPVQVADAERPDAGQSGADQCEPSE